MAKAALTRRHKKPKDSDLEAAKAVIRRTGKTVCAARVINPRDKSGAIWIDARRHSAAEVIEMASEIQRREAQRNAELRKQHGLK